MLICAAAPLRAQYFCSAPYPPENLRPDTITAYYFQDTLVPVSHIRHTHATSAVSYQSEDYRFYYLPLATKNIETFILHSLAAMPGVRMAGRWSCVAFGKVHAVLILRSKRRCQLVFYEPDTGTHLYMADGIRWARRKKVFSDIRQDLEGE